MRPVDRERHAKTRRQTAADAALLLVHAALALHLKHVAVFTSTPHTFPQIDRAAFATFSFSFSHFFVDFLQRGNRFNGACAATNSVLPLPRPFAPTPLLLSSCDRQISACDLQISRQTELKMPTWVNCCLSKQLPTPAVSLHCSPLPLSFPCYLTDCQTILITQFCSCH